MIIDLRSDTVTKPGPEMMKVMMEAQVGDDVLGDDPTVIELQNYASELFGKEASLFCPSGTMTNQIAIFLGSGPLTEVLCEETNHIFQYEGGGISFHSRASVQTLKGVKGKLNPEQVLKAINPNDIHKPVTSFLSIENTTNKGGGAFYNLQEIQALSKVCEDKNLHFHLDGARLFNALVETGDSPRDIGAEFDTISICLSKGLGAPVGSLLLGNKGMIERAKRVRKVFGGGMRQVGYLAAAGLYALKNNRERLVKDHELAKNIGKTLSDLNYVKSVYPIETNILIFELENDYSVEDFLNYLKDKNILALGMGEQKVRFVTHLDNPEGSLEFISNSLRNYNI